ncbi:MAG: phosphate ABC transporter substrate-binding protein [Thermoanaerobacteraceae bacterium]|nr:phosphate ABC transporter substrate-binding protein [Thermoanaerobacteraceae bacterium]
MLRKNVILFSIIALTFILVLAVGCGKTNSGSQEQENNNPAQELKLSGSLQIAGSSSVQPLSEELAMEFMKKFPNVKINVAGGGSGAGIKAAQDGTCDIGASSRELKPEEKNVNEFIIAKDAIAVIVNPANSVSDLTMEQIKSIFSGEVTNWKDLGGKDAPITVVIREDGSGTRGAFEEIVLGDIKFTDKAIIQNSTGALRTTVAGTPDAIGFVSLGALNDEVKALKIDGVDVTKENVLSNSYKVARPFIYMTKEEPVGLTKHFIDFVLSSEGQKIVERDFIPIEL